MGWLDSFLHPDKGYKQGQKQLDKYFQQTQNFYNQGQQYSQPYNQMGQESYQQLKAAQDALMNPQALYDKWSSGYNESDAAKNAESMAMQHGLNAASSMGLGGSSAALNALQAGTSKIGAEDKQSYLDNLMQKYLAGTGIAQNIYGTGANAAGQQGQNAMNMGQNAMNMGQNSAQMAYGAQNAGGNMFSGLLGQGIGLFGSALGGPMGGALAKRWNLSGGA